MNQKAFLFLLSASLLFLAGCAHSIHQVYVSELQPYAKIENGDIVKSQTEQFVVMGFVFDTNYVDQAKSQLISQCPNGAVTGITTQYMTSLSFFSWTHKILMQGICLKN
jgi:hypothetical protein